MRSILFISLLFFTNISFAKVTLEKLDEYDKFHRQYALLYLSESIKKEDVQSFQEAIDKLSKFLSLELVGKSKGGFFLIIFLICYFVPIYLYSLYEKHIQSKD